MIIPRIIIESENRKTVFDYLGNECSYVAVLSQIIKFVNPNTFMFINEPENRVNICNYLEISEATFRKSLVKLLNCKVLIKKNNQGHYFINKQLIELDYKNAKSY